jgi:hypothetical protein
LGPNTKLPTFPFAIIVFIEVGNPEAGILCSASFSILYSCIMATDQFLGVEKLIEMNAKQTRLFSKWAANQDWNSFHSRHYDWWAFPIDETSMYGAMYTVTPAVFPALAGRSDFIQNLRSSATDLATAYGWDLVRAAPLPHADAKVSESASDRVPVCSLSYMRSVHRVVKRGTCDLCDCTKQASLLLFSNSGICFVRLKSTRSGCVSTGFLWRFTPHPEGTDRASVVF